MPEPLTIYPTSLFGPHVRLMPVAAEHLDALCEIGLDPAIWTYYTHALRSRSDMRHWIETTMREEAHGASLPFVTVSIADDRIVGSTRFMNIDIHNRRVEIGSTWLAPPWQRTVINTEAKLLMLSHAFDTLGCHRVELRTDATNERSRAAIERLGARYEGVLRKHMVTESGRHRDTATYSIVDDEWDEIRRRLTSRLRA